MSAAVALNTITGAGLHATVFVPDRLDPDELLDEEREAYERDGTLPSRGDGRPYGNWERRPLLDKLEWHAWLETHKHQFSRQHRWRMGRPAGPLALLECLECATTPFAVRSATYEELVIRYGLTVPFEADLPVTQQQRFLGKMHEWVTRESRTFAEGGWYYAGSLQG
jgi:hypothetical protein